MIKCLKNYGWRFMTLYRRQLSRPSPKKKKCKKTKWLSEKGLQVAEKRRDAKGKGKMERYTHSNAEFQNTAKRDNKGFGSDQCKEIEENNRLGEISSRKLEIPRDHFMQGWAQSRTEVART